MIESIFRSIVGMSIIASIVALIVYVIRLTIGKYLPRSFSYYLWFLVLIRLIFPIGFSSNLSLFNYIPKTTTIISRVNNSPIGSDIFQNNIQNIPINNIDRLAPNISQSISASPVEVLIFMLSILWLIGLVFLVTQGIIRYYKATKLLTTATIVEDLNIIELKKGIGLNRNIKIYTFDGIESPLVYGLFKAKIIIPQAMVKDINTKKTSQILTHEMVHIKRFDNIFKLIWSILVYIHWFNPIVWFSARYFNEDMELSCDEKVMRIWEEDIREDYANSLISIAGKQNGVLQSGFLAFGETNIKTRIKNIMKFKKTRSSITAVGAILLGAIMLFTLTNRDEQIIYRNDNFGFELSMDKKTFDKFMVLEDKEGVYFLNKDVFENHPEYMMGTVFRIETYQKERFSREDLEEFNDIYNLRYVGENDKFYIGWAYPSDVQYPLDDDKLMKSYKSTMDRSSKVIKSIEVIDTYTDKYAYHDKLKMAYKGYVDIVGIRLGDPGKKVIENLGEPMETGYLYGALYLKYEYVFFQTNGDIDKDGSADYGTIVGIHVDESYGIKKGMSIDEVVDILGKPDGKHIYDELDEDGYGVVDPALWYLTGSYALKIPYNNDTKKIYDIEISYWREDGRTIGRRGFMDLTTREKQGYEKYIIEFDDRDLPYSPIVVMKLYLHALEEENYEAEWELFIKDEDQVKWDKKHHMEIPKEDRLTDYSIFENPVNIQIKYNDDYTEATILWEDELDKSVNPRRYSFKLVNGDYGWKVKFLPME